MIVLVKVINSHSLYSLVGVHVHNKDMKQTNWQIKVMTILKLHNFKKYIILKTDNTTIDSNSLSNFTHKSNNQCYKSTNFPL